MGCGYYGRNSGVGDYCVIGRVEVPEPDAFGRRWVRGLCAQVNRGRIEVTAGDYAEAPEELTAEEARLAASILLELAEELEQKQVAPR